MKRKTIKAMVTLLSICCLAASPAIGGEVSSDQEEYQLETMTVTAEKRSQDLQEVPAAISAISDIEVQDAGITSHDDLVGRIPNLHTINGTGTTTNLFSIRGIGQVLNTPGIGIYLDDVGYLDVFSVLTNLDFSDVERIEVLRGPQGTLYGRNAMGGVINIVTRKPDGKTRVHADATAGDFNLRQLRACVSGPLIGENLFFGLNGNYLERDGYTENTFLDKDVDFLDEQQITGKLRFAPNDRFDATLKLDYARVRDGAYPFAPINSATVWHDAAYDFADARDERDSQGGSLHAAYSGDLFEIVSITGWRKNDSETFGELDFTPADLVAAGFFGDKRQFTQEFRLASKPGDGAWEWLLGAYFFKDDHENEFIYQFGVDLIGMSLETSINDDMTDEGQALFGQATYAITDRLRCTGGLRLEREEKSITSAGTTLNFATFSVDPVNFSDDESFEDFLPRLALDYDLTPNTRLYANLAKGYRSGGFNTNAATTEDNSYDPETSINYELGLKSTWFDQRLRFNLAMFRIDIDDQQVSQTNALGFAVCRNAGESRHQGIEMELTARPTQGLDLSASFGYVDSEFEKYPEAGFDPVSFAVLDYSGNKVPLVPEYNFLLAAQYRRTVFSFADFMIRAELQGVGDMYWDSANCYKEDAHQLVNLRTGIEGENWQVYLWGKNLTDEEYLAIAFEDSFNPGNLIGGFAPPRTVGITVRVEF